MIDYQQFKQVDEEDWLLLCTLHNYYNTEFYSDTLDTIRREDGLHIATVRYLPEDKKEYWVRIKIPELPRKNSLLKI
jgi:hypothetical protein